MLISLQYIIAYPISHGKMINFVAFSSRHNLENTTFSGPWVSPANKAEFTDTFTHWEPEVQALLDVRLDPSIILLPY
jgi:salicylate hydroxylase